MIKVYGDIMLDRWIYGSCDRVSPEAPILVRKEDNYNNSIGGVGNLATNLSSINDKVELYSCVADDKEGNKLQELLDKTKIKCYIDVNAEMTTTKTRFVGQNGQQVMRWDRERFYNEDTVIEKLIENLQSDDIVCISDYAKGTVKANTLQQIFRKAKVLVDPKQDNYFYDGAFLVKPNMKEYVEWFGEFDEIDAGNIMRKHNWQWLVVTDGANGMHVLSEDSRYRHFKELTDQIVDVTGAGDTVLAVIAHGLSQGKDVFEACEIACYAAARAVERQGTTIITSKDLKRKVTVWTNGVFDVLHKGHFELLKYASKQGDKLIVGINSDTSVKRLKGETRPINNEIERKSQLESLPWVDQVVIFTDDTPLNKIKEYEPDIIVKGGDYSFDTVVGNTLAEVKIFPTVQGVSTTKTIGKINNDNISKN